MATKKKKIEKTRKKAVNGRNKGANQERKLAKLLSDWWGAKVYRTPGSGAWATSHTDGKLNSAGDIVCEDPNFPFCVESKKVEGWHLEQLLTSPKCIIRKWWQQTLDETPVDKEPLLIFSRNGLPELMMVHHKSFLADFLWCRYIDAETLFVGSLETRIYKLSDLFVIDPKELKEYYKLKKEGQNE